MSSPSAGKRRMDTDVIKLIESKHEVTILRGLNEFAVKFYGPKGTAYEQGVWRVRVELPEKYPFKSPSIGFMNKIYHPNIDETSGTVCLDVINQTWSALYDLTNIFESFLPQLLTYPNPTDPLNGDAAALYLHKPDEFKKKCTDYVERYATEEALRRYCPETDGPDCSQARPDSARGTIDTTPGSHRNGSRARAAQNGTTGTNGTTEDNDDSDASSMLSEFSEDEMTKDMEL